MASTFEAVKNKVADLVSGETDQQTNTSGKKIVVVFGATGKQGGAVVDSILSDQRAASEFKIRAITRDPNGDKAQKLKSKGVECVAADLDDKASLKKAFEGAYAVWCVTNYWEKMDGEVEYQQGKNAADAAKAEGVQHFIFSSLANISEASNGKYPGIYHFDNKAKIEEYIRSQNIPATFFLPGFYMSNFPGGMFNKDDNGHWSITLPLPDTAVFPLFDAEDDTGKWVKHILLNRSSLLGHKIYGASGIWTPAEMIREFKEVFPNAGKTARHNQVGDAEYKGILGQMGMPEKAQEEMLQNMQILYDKNVGYYGDGESNHAGKNLDHLKLRGVDKPTTWKEYIQKAPAFKDLN